MTAHTSFLINAIKADFSNSLMYAFDSGGQMQNSDVSGSPQILHTVNSGSFIVTCLISFVDIPESLFIAPP
jgi:hypothetical protein